MAEEEYVIKESPTSLELAEKVAEPILSLVALAVLYFYGIDWLLNPLLSFFSQFDWFATIVAIVDRLTSMLTWLPPFNGNDGPSLPFNNPLPFKPDRALDLIFTLAELVIGIAVIVEAIDASILAVRSDGVTIRDVSVPWSSIRQVVITQPKSSASESSEVEIGLRLVSNGSLPDDHDVDLSTSSETPSALRISIDSQSFNREHLATAVDRFAPENVSLVKIRGEAEEDRHLQEDDEEQLSTRKNVR
ncbi:hypothetical protein [Saliphagus sp. LR7]|uniref:hypothetical protein n=1 Tax=Saliphagus sp. LR7 TaxID=2282654 RepID=UPI00130037AC|nr:hypothetical protein [Saliphagus sp. LR7]